MGPDMSRGPLQRKSPYTVVSRGCDAHRVIAILGCETLAPHLARSIKTVDDFVAVDTPGISQAQQTVGSWLQAVQPRQL
jgi:hypothetical protein